MKRTTFPGELLVSLRRGEGQSLREQLEGELRTAIQRGRLTCGAALPSSRALAADLGVSRGVVVLAYDQLLAEGYLVASRGSATRVASRPPARPAIGVTDEPAAGPRYDFRPGLPDTSIFPRRAWLSSLRRVLAVPDVETALGYPDPQGARPARLAIAAYLNRTRGTVARAERTVLCTGFAQGLRLVCDVLRQRGVTRVAVEDPGHGGQRADIAAMGLRVSSVPVDDSGLRVDRLTRLNVGAVLVTPAHQFPTGVVMAPRRRQALLEWASRHDAIVIEDDYDAEFRFDREPVGTLQGLAEDHVAYIGSTSKTLAPALRIGWLLMPRRLVDRTALAKLHADHGSPTLDQLTLAEFITSGGLDRHLRKARLLYRRRRDAMVAALQSHLPASKVRGVAAGLHLMVALPAGTDEDAVLAAAEQRSMRIYGVGPHRARDAGAALLLGYASLPEADIRAGVALLASCLADKAPGTKPRPIALTRIWDPAERRLLAGIAAEASIGGERQRR
jgi:GntR family transcriptional regulator / MocR family aminotransferase